MPRRRAQAGFTLIEVIVVVVILGLVGSLVLVRQPTRSATINTEATLRALSGALQLARSRAIVVNRPVSVVVTEHSFAVEDGQSWQLPSGISLTPMRVVFLSDGGSTGGLTRLSDKARAVLVSVSWLTGSVQVKEQPNVYKAVSSIW